MHLWFKKNVKLQMMSWKSLFIKNGKKSKVKKLMKQCQYFPSLGEFKNLKAHFISWKDEDFQKNHNVQNIPYKVDSLSKLSYLSLWGLSTKMYKVVSQFINKILGWKSWKKHKHVGWTKWHQGIGLVIPISLLIDMRIQNQQFQIKYLIIH
jgi:hypothetical protein